MRDMYLVYEARVNNVEIAVFLSLFYLLSVRTWHCCLPCLAGVLERTNFCSCTIPVISSVHLGQSGLVWEGECHQRELC